MPLFIPSITQLPQPVADFKRRILGAKEKCKLSNMSESLVLILEALCGRNLSVELTSGAVLRGTVVHVDRAMK